MDSRAQLSVNELNGLFITAATTRPTEALVVQPSANLSMGNTTTNLAECIYPENYRR